MQSAVTAYDDTTMHKFGLRGQINFHADMADVKALCIFFFAFFLFLVLLFLSLFSISPPLSLYSPDKGRSRSGRRVIRKDEYANLEFDALIPMVREIFAQIHIPIFYKYFTKSHYAGLATRVSARTLSS